MDLGLQGRVALVTGASKGLGFAIAQALAAEGVKVAITSRDEDRVQSFLQQRPMFDPMDLMNSNRGVFGLNLAHLWGERRFAAASMEALLTDFAGGRLKAVVAKAFPHISARNLRRGLTMACSFRTMPCCNFAMI